MIGEVVKLGFDGSQVNRGLKGIMGGFGKLRRGIGSATRQVGIGIGRQMGVSIFQVATKALSALPNQLQELAKLNKEIEVMGITTGTSTKQFLAMREAMSKVTGKGAEDAGDDLKDFSERMTEARMVYKSSANQGLIRLGINVTDMDHMDLEEKLANIGKAVKKFEADNGKGKSIFPLREAFGDQSANWLPLLLGFDEHMTSAYERTKVMSDLIKELGDDLKGVEGIGFSFSRKLKEASLGFLGGLKDSGVIMGGIAEWIESLDVAGAFRGFGSVIATELAIIKEDGIWDWMGQKMTQFGGLIWEGIKTGLSKLWGYLKENMGIIVEHIKAAIASVMPAYLGGDGGKSLDKLMGKETTASTSSGGIFDIFKNGGKSGPDPQSTMIAENTSRTNVILERMSDTNTTSVYT